MSRTPIQVPEEIKSEVDKLKDKFHTKTHYEVIERLIKYYYENEQLKKENHEKQQRDKEERYATTVYLGEDLKRQYKEEMNSLNLRNEPSLFSFLLEHYHNSRDISKLTLDHLLKLEQG